MLSHLGQDALYTLVYRDSIVMYVMYLLECDTCMYPEYTYAPKYIARDTLIAIHVSPRRRLTQSPTSETVRGSAAGEAA